jgi:histidine ammonia-lyase
LSDPAHPAGSSAAAPITLDGESLALEQLVRIARHPSCEVRCAPAALDRVRHGWSQIERIARDYRQGFERFHAGETAESPVQDYGVTTGFGEFKDIPVRPDRLEDLQRNILLSHAVGVGDDGDPDNPANYFPPEVVRAALAIRCNAFLKGHSGVRVELVETVAAMLNRGIVPLVPIRGSVGSSGDLCPLAHLFVVLLGEGRYAVVREPTTLARAWGRLKPAAELAADLGVDPPKPSFKEGLALTNGATFSTAMLALAVADTEKLANVADAAVALTLEAVCGCARAFDPRIHDARQLRGQIDSAANLRSLLEESELLDSAGAVQDPYSLRCAPAVHGASRDAVSFAKMVAEREINAATDNPLFFPGEDGGHQGEPWDFRFRKNWPAGYRGDLRYSYSAGNFHGQPVGMAADFLAIAVAELADVAERRTQMLLDQHHNRNLPANLIPHRGLNSGFMIAQYTAAALVSENKVLAHPASVDSIPTSANSEDHVAMATHAARKLRSVLANSQAVLAIELLVAAQAVEWRVGMNRSPLGGSRDESPEPAAAAGAIDSEEARDTWCKAEAEDRAFREAVQPARREALVARLGKGSRAVYLAVREAAGPMLEDRPLDGDIAAVRRRLEDGSLAAAASAAVTGGLRPVAAVTAPAPPGE